jgi:hypothetical protein
VLARLADGRLTVLLGPDDLELAGSVDAFERAVRSRVSASAC